MTATLRPFDWRDLPVLHRYRTKGLCLDTALGVTRGANLTSGVLLSYLAPATGIFTWICANECDEQPLMGQMTHSQDEVFARLSFLAPEETLGSPSLVNLLEQLAVTAGERGAHNLLAETDEDVIAFEALRKSGFAIYARQRIWKLEAGENQTEPKIPWKPVREKDIFGIQILYHNVVPGLVQQIEPLPNKQMRGLVCHYEGEIIGYADLKSGPRGIWVHPFLLPDVEEVDTLLRDLTASIPNQRGRPIYICVRTYQSWLEPALRQLNVEASPSQAVMVKRLAIQKRSPRAFAIPQIEGQGEITTPISQSKQNGSSMPHVTKP